MRHIIRVIVCFSLFNSLQAQPKSPANASLKAPSWMQTIEGKGHRTSWLAPIALPEFDLLKGEYEPFMQLENVGTVLLDRDKRKFLLHPIPASPEKFPFAAFIVETFAKKLGIQTTSPKIVRYLGNAHILEAFVFDQVKRESLTNEQINPIALAQTVLLAALVRDPAIYPIYYTRENFQPILMASTNAFSQKDGWSYAYNAWEDGRFKLPKYSEKWQSLSMELGLRGTQGEVITIAGLLPQDRDILATIGEAEWQRLAREMQTKLNDAAIQEAFTILPPEIAAKEGVFLIKALKKRRDSLDNFTAQFFQILQKMPQGETAFYQPDYKKHDYSFAFNDDDNTFVGWVTNWVKGGFKQPYNASHRLEWNIAPKTGANNVEYEGRITDFVGKNDLIIEAYSWHHTNPHTFYALGNETANTETNRTYYQTQRYRNRWKIGLTQEMGLFSWESAIFGEYQHLYGKQAANRPQQGILQDAYKGRLFVGTELKMGISQLKNKNRWFQSGFEWENTARFSLNPQATDERFVQTYSDAAWYQQLKRVNVSARIGGAHIVGTYPFYAANRLGQLTNLRGFWQRRFGGRSIVYANTEARFKLFEFPYWDSDSRTGLLFFADSGRAWTDGETSKTWHLGYGAGIWTEAYGETLTASVGFSKENMKGLPLLRMQWQF